MNALIAQDIRLAFAWTLIHFVWQGVAIAGLLALSLRLLRRQSSNLRYVVACGAMLLMLVAAVSTFAFLWQDSAQPAGAGVVQSKVASSAAVASKPAVVSAPVEQGSGLVWLVYLWFGGVLALSIRTSAGFVSAQRFKRRSAHPVPEMWRQRFERIARKLEIDRRVEVCQSALAEVPAVVGWLRPVVLVPASALAGLQPTAIEALMAHELAHVRRHDYLVNLLQTAVETLLFYHPAVWWVGSCIRTEREHCCDDLAVSVSGNVLTYVKALADLEQFRQTPRFAMAANRGSLLSRIRRLVRPQEVPSTNSSDWMTGIAILLSVLAIWSAGHVNVAQAMSGEPVHAINVAWSSAAPPDPPAPIADLQEPAPPAPPAPPASPAVAFEAPDPMPPAAPEAPAAPAEPQEPATPAPPASGGFIGSLAAAGYSNLSVDQLIAFKIHGVTGEFIQKVKAAGFQPTPDQLVAMRIHGVNPEEIAGLKAAGLGPLTIDNLVAMRIHGVSVDYARRMKAAGFGDPTLDQLLAMRIHGVTPEFATEMKAAGVTGVTLDSLIAMRIHGVNPAFVKQVQKHGFKDLSVDKIIKLKQFGIITDADVI